ncbi:hypothetical protein [Nostoc sp. 'Peltigera membranacea cyanobiont' 232]|uniref:hypothetical protein n=1 Tax=Nostoc sp. 'Peltigera membranacea cyanobiont' 232 TaxID=2014531 RepID=UPI00117D4050|nr:hypothetical protein [Nostoc sp. 'Peltigera membranacea cyanobiont' 232]
MASNRFFSGRIPNELYEQAEKHCEETGDSKTEVLIKALSTYLNFPIAIPGKNIIAPSPEVTKEMFETLEERIRILEHTLKALPVNVINNNNDDNKSRNTEEIEEANNDNSVKTSDNKTDSLNVESKIQDVIINDNRIDNPEKSESDNILEAINNEGDNNKPKTNKPVIKINNKNNNKPLQTEVNKIISESKVSENLQELPKFEEIITAEVVKKTNLSRSQVDYLMSKAIEKIKQQGKVIKPRKLLEEPIEVINKSGIQIEGNLYRLFYAGENFKEKPVWNLIPDNESYQNVILGLLNPNITHNNTSYQVDNNKDFKEENLINEEMVKKNENLFTE